jgi:hypothetical protein
MKELRQECEQLREEVAKEENAHKEADRRTEALARENSVLGLTLKDMRSDVDTKLSQIMDELIKY